MLIHKLKFNPHVVWHRNGGFHVFGYINNHYHYLSINDGVSKTWERNQVAGTIQGSYRSVCHFNKVIQKEDIVTLIRYGTYGVLTDHEKNLRFTTVHHDILNEVFPLNGNMRKCNTPEVTYIPSSANFDRFGDAHIFAWGTSFVHERANGETRLIRQPYERDAGHVSCTDAKFSPDGNKIAVSIKDSVQFRDTQTLEVERELSMEGHKIHFMSYSEDGCTLGTITTCRKLIIWDVD